MIEEVTSLCRTPQPRKPLLDSLGKPWGFTAVEVLIALVILSVVAAFSVRAFDFTRRIYLETEQLDFATQMGRDILSHLKSGADWKEVRRIWEEKPLRRYNTSFEIQFTQEQGEGKGYSDLEVSITWISPRGLKQQVYNTSVFDRGDIP